MKSEAVWLAIIVVITALTSFALFYYRFKISKRYWDLTGLWMMSGKQLRILIHDVDSVFQGTIAWANGKDQLLGKQVLEGIKLNGSGKATGKYTDPFTNQEINIEIMLSGKDKLLIKELHVQNPNQESFVQEWNKIDS